MHLIVSPQMEGLGNWVVGRPNSYKWVVSGPRIPPDLRYALPSPRHHGACACSNCLFHMPVPMVPIT